MYSSYYKSPLLPVAALNFQLSHKERGKLSQSETAREWQMIAAAAVAITQGNLAGSSHEIKL